MNLTIDISPDDLANIIVDNSIHVLHCRNVLESIIKSAKKQLEVQSEEVEQIDYLLSEYKFHSEERKQQDKEKQR